MLAKHLGLPKFYAPSKVLTLGAKEFSGEGGSSEKDQPQRALKLISSIRSREGRAASG